MVYGQYYADHVTENLNKSATSYKKLSQPNVAILCRLRQVFVCPFVVLVLAFL